MIKRLFKKNFPYIHKTEKEKTYRFMDWLEVAYLFIKNPKHFYEYLVLRNEKQKPVEVKKAELDAMIVRLEKQLTVEKMKEVRKKWRN